MKPLSWAALLLAFVVTNGIVLIIGIPSSALGWVSLAIMNLAFVLACVAPLLARGRTRFVFGYPLASVALVQWIIQFALTLLIVILGVFDVEIAWRIFVLLQLVLIGAFGFVFLTTASVASTVSESLQTEAQQRVFLQDGARTAGSLARSAQSWECKAKCLEIEELFRFSPAKSSPGVAESEQLCLSLLHQAEVDVSAGRESDATNLLDEVARLLQTRNASLRSGQ